MLSCCDTLACVMLVVEVPACSVCASVGVGYITEVEANINSCMSAHGKHVGIIMTCLIPK
jgi:hypothetical protein